MKTWKKLALCAACLAAFSFAMPDYADAARLGRGRSFGSSSIMKNPAPAPSGIKAGSSSSATTMNRQATGQQNVNGAGAATMAQNRGGLFGGLFGGLLAGTLLGSLFSGTGLGGAIGGFMNILLFVALGFFAMRLFRRMRGGQQEDRRQDWQNPYSQNQYGQNQYGQQSQGSAWDALRSEPQAAHQATAEEVNAVPADFDQDEFLRGAKAAYTRLQASWDRRDLNDIANFATEDVMAELREQAASDPEPAKTEILLVNASVLEVRDEGDLRRVAVYFDVLMRENQNAAHPEQVREVWHFVCSTAAGDSWKLDGIQQLA